MRISIILIGVIAGLISCSNALDYEVGKMTDDQRKTVQQVLTADQSARLESWISRYAAAGNGLPSGVTVQQALDDQTNWIAKQAVDKAKAEQARNQLLSERSAMQRELARIATVELISKKNEILEDHRQFVSLEIAYDDKADKDIMDIKGVLKLSDSYGHAVIDIDLSYNRIIPAGHTVVDHDAGIIINQSVEPQLQLWDTDFDKLSYTFETHTILFKNGTRMSAKE
jgi:hypothetical protein